jgi:phosphatidylethanolamine/phosphatidyl-N-methylethanolamine N-methyltransferase
MKMDWLSHWYRLCYALWSPFYDLMVRGFAGWRRRSLELADLQAGERVLIVGAGTGSDLQFIDPGPRITAIDVTKAMLQRLRRRARRRGLTVDAQVMDGQAMDFADGSFDVVILHLILAVIPDPARCARESARVLRSGGRVVIMDKFIADDRRPPMALLLANPLLRLLGTNANRKLGPILEGTGLRIVRQEPAGLGGLFKIALLRKG